MNIFLQELLSFFKNWLPLKRVVKTKIELASLLSVPIQIKNSSMRPCDAKEMRLLRHHHYTLIEYGQSLTDDLES